MGVEAEEAVVTEAVMEEGERVNGGLGEGGVFCLISNSSLVYSNNRKIIENLVEMLVGYVCDEQLIFILFQEICVGYPSAPVRSSWVGLSSLVW